MIDRPDPKSFDTLEKAQAEIARCYGVLDTIVSGLLTLDADGRQAQAETRRLLGDKADG